MGTLGRWIGQIRRMGDEVRTEVSRELNLNEIQETFKETRKEFTEAATTIKETASEMRQQYTYSYETIKETASEASSSLSSGNGTLESAAPVENVEISTGEALVQSAVEESLPVVVHTNGVASPAPQPSFDESSFSWQDALMNNAPVQREPVQVSAQTREETSGNQDTRA
jgi:Sec-independent protein translocase protein TatA